MNWSLTLRGRRKTPILVVVLAIVAFVPWQATGAAQPVIGANKIDSHILELLDADAAGQNVAAYARGHGLRASADKKILVDVYFTGTRANAVRLLQGQGMEVGATNDRDPFRIVEGWLPLGAVRGIASNPAVTAVLAITGVGVDIGSVNSQGDAAHNGPAARALGVNGAGVVVGVISDSINQIITNTPSGPQAGVATSQASGDLPANVTILQDDATNNSDEGRAMSEIIYDTATGVTNFFFSSGTNGGPAGKAASINNLVANNVDLIADDIFYLIEPYFQDGQVSQAVDAAVANGVAYFASAGNRARQSYESNYVDNGGLHDFDPGAAVDTRQTVVQVPNNRFFQAVLQWAEPWGNAATDLDLVLRNVNTGVILAQDNTNNIAPPTGNGLPMASVTWTNNTGAAVTVALDIARAGGTGAPFMKYIARGNFGPFNVTEFDTQSNTINPDAAAAAGSLAVAAVDWNDAGLNDPEAFSSRGLITRRFDAAGNPQVVTRQKPQIAGADNVATSVPGFNPFQGTSAATPSVAGVAALVLDGTPTLTPAQLYARLTNTANTIDCNAAGQPDTDCGFGFVLADRAVGSLDTTPPGITPTVTGTLGNNGWYVSDVTVTWMLDEPTSFIQSSSGCGSTTINTDTAGVTLTCTATSVGGTASQSVTIKRDATPPTLNPVITPNPIILNGTATIVPGAADAMSGLASSSCGALDTTTPGPHTVTCTATDNAGNIATVTVTYYVLYNFSGFFAPVDNLPLANGSKAGQAVPIKWQITDANGVGISDPATFVSITASSLTCDLGSTTDAIEEYASGGSGLLYHGEGNWQFNWKTPTSYAKSCKTMKLNLNDTVGMTDAQLAALGRTAQFRFTK